ncbi:class I SAM-dependent methyltransferase [Haliangium sp.]|uniref:class I SAM-dependent methyltransferase n=1 Tax=Haliangium sp. TaxID=2663208 RepID=UPI003D14F747
MDVLEYNRRAWDAQVGKGNKWTQPVSPELIARARAGDWHIVLTPMRPVPRDWFPALVELPTLCLASGGGQQAPILAAAGARVTVLDNAPAQLAQDRLVAEREGLDMTLIEGDMRDLTTFADASFSLIVHPVSNLFVPDIRPVWQECARVLAPGGVLLAGFCLPVMFLFDYERSLQGELVVRHRIPYSDLADLDDDERRRLLIDKNEPLVFGHSLEDQIGGQVDAGMAITGFFEDRYEPEQNDPLSTRIATFAATRARKG